jgi:NADPH-dependent 2,4-dienoyl-CoA reductase/sulfur reductase-like enzyme
MGDGGKRRVGRSGASELGRNGPEHPPPALALDLDLNEAFLLDSPRSPLFSMADIYDCVIIGAGWSGAVTARSLANAGFKVVVLEARDRVGGRAQTCTDAGLHSPIDLGCSWIHGESISSTHRLRP